MRVTVSVKVAVKEEAGVFLAKCPFLNILSQGASEQEAVSNLLEELAFLFESCASPADLEAVLDRRTSARREPFLRDGVVRIERLDVARIPLEVLKRFADASIPVV